VNDLLAISAKSIMVTHSAAAPILPPIISLRYMFPGIITNATKSTPKKVLRVNPSSNSEGTSIRLLYSSISW